MTNEELFDSDAVRYRAALEAIASDDWSNDEWDKEKLVHALRRCAQRALDGEDAE